MIFNNHFLNFIVCFLTRILVSSSAAKFCSFSTIDDYEHAPCFLEIPANNPIYLRPLSNSLTLPCHVAYLNDSIIEWWYQDFEKSINLKILPAFASLRPLAIPIKTHTPSLVANIDEANIIDASILLRYVDTDDSGVYHCVIRPPMAKYNENNNTKDNSSLSILSYAVEFRAPRLCQTSSIERPCFTNMYTTSPTIIEAYQTAFLQCIVHSHGRSSSIYWVVGDEVSDDILISANISQTLHNGDQLRRIFPISEFDYSIEITLNRDVSERVYSCLIDGITDVETTLFTYIVRSIDPEGISEKTIKSTENETLITTTTTTTTTIKESEQQEAIINLDKTTAQNDPIRRLIDEFYEKEKQHE